MRDECFVRGKIPMTKSEVRAVSLSKLEIRPNSIVYDIGAGTGSVTVEAAKAAPFGQVFAFEQKEEGCELIRANCEKHGISNVKIIPGKAPESIQDLPAPDQVFIGGSGGNLSEILDRIREQNPRVRIVLNVIALETLSQIMAYCKERRLEPEVVCLQVARGEQKGAYHLMQGQNPVYILTICGKQEREKQEEGMSAIPRIMIAAPESGSGKTMITIGLLTIFKRRGLCCSSFKCGPDYIDPLFHRYVVGVESCNLDSFFLSEQKVQQLFVRHAEHTDLAVIEGVMGYYDGVAGNTTQASAYDISRITKTPVILVLDGKSSSLSLAAQIRGFQMYRPDSRIAGVILNRTSGMMLERLRPQIEELGVRCLGTVPICEEAKITSRHLGLTLPEEQENLRQQLLHLADRLEQTLDIGAILELAGAAQNLPVAARAERKLPISVRRMAVAKDEAFCFYYEENLEFLREEGWELVEFSPIHDEKLPEHLDGILLGGGYPELYAEQLSMNGSMREAIRRAAQTGIRILAECGGFLYLHQTLEGMDGNRYPMAGVILADGFRTDHLSRFGYISLEEKASSKPCTLKGHEFHYWESTCPGNSMRARKPLSSRGWDCMYQTESMLAGFPHLYYRSDPDWIRSFLK